MLLQTRVYDGKSNDCGPVHITAGAGGNREGLATRYAYILQGTIAQARVHRRLHVSG